jgi:hypothetical protein
MVRSGYFEMVRNGYDSLLELADKKFRRVTKASPAVSPNDACPDGKLIKPLKILVI